MSAIPKYLSILFSAALIAPSATANGAPRSPLPVEVMVVGDFHMANPGLDLHNMHVDDMLTPRRQREIGSVVAALARFKPTKVGLESRSARISEQYRQYVAGNQPPSRNEVVQLGFRLARSASAKSVYSLDAPGDFPFERVKAFAEAHGLSSILDEQSARTQHEVDEEARRLAGGTVGSTLRFLNDPDRLRNGNAFYRTMLRVGSGTDQPGADLLADWYKRNALICAKLIQLAEPGDRIVIFFGAGHAFLLRQCVTETAGFKLIEPNKYLPR